MQNTQKIKARIEFPVEDEEEFERLKEANKLPDEKWYLGSIKEVCDECGK